MGSDVIYTQRKATPRMFVVIISWAILVAVSLFVFNGPSLHLWLWFGASFVGILLYMGIEYRHASKLVKGSIETVRVSDLTKAIYWLSIVSSRRAPGHESFYYRNVTKAVKNIGGKLETEWNEIMKKYKPLNLNLYVFLVVATMASSVGIAVGQSARAAWMIWFFVGLSFALILVLVIIFRRTSEEIESFVRNKETTKMTRLLAQELISWTSERTKAPIRVLLAETNYSAIKVVDSIYDVAIVQIEPKDILTQSEWTTESKMNG